MVGSIFPTEIALKKTFDENGFRWTKADNVRINPQSYMGEYPANLEVAKKGMVAVNFI